MKLDARKSPYKLSWLGSMALACLAVLLLSVWIAVVWGLYSLHQEAIRSQVQESSNISRVLQEQVTRVLEIIDKAALRVNDATTSARRPQDALKNIEAERLASETGLAPEVIAQLGIVGADGRFAYSNLDPTGEKSAHVDLSEREHIKVHLQPELLPQSVARINAHGLFIGVPVLGKVSQRWTIQITRRLNNHMGERAGVVVVSVNPGYFEQVFKDVRLGPSGTIALVGDDDVVRAQVVGGRYVGMGEVLKVAAQDPQEARTAAQTHFIRTDDAGVRHVVVTRRVPGYPLRLMISTTSDWALANWNETRNITLILAILLSLGAAGATVFFVRVVRQIENNSEALRAQHQLQEMTMDAMQDGVLRLDRQGRLVDANPMALELLGVQKDAVLGARIDEVLPGEQGQQRLADGFAFDTQELTGFLARKIQQAAGRAPAIPIPLLRLDAQGRLLWATSTACELLGLDVAAVPADALSQETVAQLLQARQLQQQQPVQVAHTVDIAWRVGDLRTLVLSTMLLPADEQAQTLDVWIIPDLDGLSAFAIRSLHNIEWRILRLAHSDEIPVLLAASPLLDPYHRITGAVLTLKDMRDVKAQEAENLRMVKKMEQSQKLDALGQLAAGVAHDFNNLLGVIQSHAELVEMKIGTESPALKNLNAILQASARAQNIVLSLNTLGRDAKKEHEPQDAQQNTFDLMAVLHETQSLLQASLKGIDISLQTIGQVPQRLELQGDSGALQQVMVNLCVNASHAIGEHRKGRITIEVGSAPNGFVLLDVVDNGSGIAPDILPRIFEPFFTTKSVGKGTGLGLAMVHSIITKMKGTIECQSELGVGTRFSMRLPSVSARQQAVEV